jgi:hypothetical protein
VKKKILMDRFLLFSVGMPLFETIPIITIPGEKREIEKSRGIHIFIRIPFPQKSSTMDHSYVLFIEYGS